MIKHIKIGKNKATAITFLLILTIAISMFVLPNSNSAKAVDLSNIGWYTKITASPNPVGVGQQVTIVAGFTFPTQGFGYKTYSGWTITVTNPQGIVTKLGPLNSDSTGFFFATFTPDVIGNWTFQAHYPGGLVDFEGISNATVPAKDTNVFALTVQQQPVLEYPAGAPFPATYWQEPIYAENRLWATLGGNWLMPGGISGGRSAIYADAYNPYTTVPNTGHILWTRPTLIGGMIGGATDDTYYAGSSYRPEMVPPVVINGRLYYVDREVPKQGFYCVDLYTGQTIWHNNATYPDGKGGLIQGQSAQITLGQVLNLGTRNWWGGAPFLWSTGATTWGIWDAFTGNLAYTMINAPNIATSAEGVTLYTDPQTGALITFVYDETTNTFVRWNSTRVLDLTIPNDISQFPFETGPRYNLDWKLGIEWNVTLPVLSFDRPVPPGTAATGAPSPPTNRGQWIYDRNDPSVIIFTNHTRGYPLATTAFEDMAVSGIDGHVMWRKVRNEGTWEEISGGFAMSIQNDAYVLHRKETSQLYAYSVSTGDKLWSTTLGNGSFWEVFPRGPTFAYDKVITSSYDGIVEAHYAKNGTLAWSWGPVSSGYETPYGVYPFIGGMTIADHKLMISSNEHSGGSPLYRGERMYVIDVDNGSTVWSALGWWQWPIAVDSFVLAPNGYDGKIYNFGKGPSATTLSAPSVGTTLGTSVTLSGTVTDISAGTKQNEQASRFPNGVPAVSDQSMDAWMQYVYMQKPLPTDITGVGVSIDVLDSNNNFRHIGNTTTDANGFYSLNWKPDIPGKYTVYATFSGSESYWQSNAEAAFVVEQAPANSNTPVPPETASMADQYFVPFSIGMIIAIIVAAIAIILALRKRP